MSEVNLRLPASASASRRASTLFSCTSSVTCQNSTIPVQAASTATPWISDHSHGLAWADMWLKIRSRCQVEPTTWLIVVKRIMNRNGIQSW